MNTTPHPIDALALAAKIERLIPGDPLAAELRRLHIVEQGFQQWMNKTEWVQKSAQSHELGMHRADVLKQRIDCLVDGIARTQAEIAELKFQLESVGAGGVGPLMPTAAQQPSVGYRRAIMGFGRVAVGGCKGSDNQLPGIIYLDMDGEQREPDTPCDDLFQPGTAPDPSKILACIHFSTAASVFQTIDVLHELLEDEFGIAQQQPKAQD